ncbi:MAG TPA: ATP-dependent DNA helicase RecG [Pyrinomonadaceae bacterium]|nr:ATP-dependent DNA helicase RecG [Pyrinomonadaceae bacterium]
MPSSLSLDTPVSHLYKYRIGRLGQVLSQKLAVALAAQLPNKNASQVTVGNLLEYLPMRYEDRSRPAGIRDLQAGREASLELITKLAGGYQVRNRRGFSRSLYIFEISAEDPEKSGRPVVVWWFVSGGHAQDIIRYYTKKFNRGARFVTFGRWEWDARRGTFSLHLNKPADELEMLPGSIADAGTITTATRRNGEEQRINAIHVGRPVPVYRKLGEFQSQRVREILYGVLDQLPSKSIPESLPPDLLKRQNLISRERALREIHFPPAEADLSTYENFRSAAHVRFIFEDFFWLAFALMLKRGHRRKESKGRSVRIDSDVKNAIAAILPFKLTAAQRRVVKEIFLDLKSDAPMNRLLQGDVGSGKTVVALITMMAAMENSLQSALMVPTEILAEQHARNIKRLLAKTPYRVELLTGSMRSAEKKRLHADIAAGEIHACIGTHALIQEAVKFNRLGLVVIDEQHRFGVVQRAELRARGLNPDVLVMTATPIPRSLAMTVYGDLDVSVIDELPPGRTPIQTVVFGEDQRREVKQLIASEISAGHQAYVVYPLVEESEKMDLKDATKRYEYLRDRVFPKFSVGLIHGRLKPAEKEEIMRRFVAGEIQILVSTTVIEVGVDVPNASVMIVEHAERFGLSQLHQLRGRVGRGADKSYCLLLTSDKKTTVAEERLGIMSKTNDGFVIAEKDLEIRGAGELMGTRQSGIPEFRVGNLVRDQRILERARKEAERYLNKGDESAEAVQMMQRARQDPRFDLAAVG